MVAAGEEVPGALDVKREEGPPKPPFPESILNMEAVRHVTALDFAWEDGWPRSGLALGSGAGEYPPAPLFC